MQTQPTNGRLYRTIPAPLFRSATLCAMSESNLESLSATDAEAEAPAAPPGAMARRFRGYLPVVCLLYTSRCV